VENKIRASPGQNSAIRITVYPVNVGLSQRFQPAAAVRALAVNPPIHETPTLVPAAKSFEPPSTTSRQFGPRITRGSFLRRSPPQCANRGCGTPPPLALAAAHAQIRPGFGRSPTTRGFLLRWIRATEDAPLHFGLRIIPESFSQPVPKIEFSFGEEFEICKNRFLRINKDSLVLRQVCGGFFRSAHFET